MKRIGTILYQRPFLVFLLFLLAAYLPVLLPWFHLKNDILTQNLPMRFVFGESVYSGFEPFWNPYLHYGTPQYGDMNNGFWNPVQWMIGSTTGYSILTITLEEMFYILIGGWGLYKVAREFVHRDIALITGLTYMCCGFVVGHMQYLCWITGVAYFPYVLLFFIRINKLPNVRNFLLGGISVFLFIASTHPGLIIGAAYFFLFVLLTVYFNRRSELLRHFYHRRFFAINGLFLLMGALLSIVVIYSNIDVLQQISRGSKVSLKESLRDPTTFQSYLSLLFPLAVNKSDFFNTDIAMRNVFPGLLTLAGVLLFFKTVPRRLAIWSSAALLFFILLAGGGWFKTFAWSFLPFTGFVRINGEFAYFVVLILLLIGAWSLHYFRSRNLLQPISRMLGHLAWLSIVAIVIAVVGMLVTRSSIFFNFPSTASGISETIRLLAAEVSAWDLLFAQAVIQVVFLVLLKKSASSSMKLAFINCVHLVIITWLLLPFTALGKMPRAEVQGVIDQFPRGISTQPLISINDAEYIHPANNNLNQFLLISSYSKKIGHPLPDQYPVQLHSNIAFYADTALFSFISKQSYLFLSSDTTLAARTTFDTSHIHVLRSGAGYTSCIVRNDSFSWLTLLQNNYPNWKVKVDGKVIKHHTGFTTFISIPIQPGEHTVEFIFDSTVIKSFLNVNLLLLIAAIVLICIPRIANKKLFT